MFQSLKRGWSLTKTSFRVLSLDKEILALPLLSGLVLVLLTASFLVPAAALGVPEGPAGLVVLFAFYVAAYFVTLWFNAAVVEMATIRFNGGDPVLKDGLAKAWQRKGRILQWAVVAATVGIILRVLDNAARQNNNPMMQMVGRIGVALAGAAWNIATFFVMPVLIYQDKGPFDALKTSVGTWKGTWGEGLGAIFSTSIVFFALGLLGVVPVVLGFMSGSAMLALGLIGVAVVYWVLLAAANAAVDGIVTAALYKYAVDGKLPEAFEGADVPRGPVQPLSPYA